MASLMSGILNTWLLLASFSPWYFIDKLGRRPLFIIGTLGQLTAMAVSAGSIYKVEQNGPDAHYYAIVAASMLFLYLGTYTFGMQASVWVYASEVTPLRVRVKAAAISTASNWISNFLVVEITPPAIANVGYKTYIIYSVFNAVWLPIIYFYLKETKGLSLEALDLLFANEAGIAEHNLAAQQEAKKLEDLKADAEVVHVEEV
jgi:MFS family permease